MDRRELLRGAMAGTLTLWAAPIIRASQQAGANALRQLTDKIALIEAGGSNVIVFSASGFVQFQTRNGTLPPFTSIVAMSASGIVLVDTGAPKTADAPGTALNGFAVNGKVQTVFNTHYHLDHTGNNETFSAAGAKIIAHDRTRQWMSNDYWLPDQDRYEKARPKAAWPTESFFDTGSLEAGGEHIDYGHLIMAHTSGDIYVHFKDSNVLVVGDVASPVNDPELDWIAGAWIGGRVDAMDLLLKISNDQTKIVPGTGSVMTRSEFKAERDMMEEVRARLFKEVREGDGPQDMLEAGVLKGLARTWKDPYKFLYAAAKGLWGNHNKLDANVV